MKFPGKFPILDFSPLTVLLCFELALMTDCYEGRTLKLKIKLSILKHTNRLGSSLPGSNEVKMSVDVIQLGNSSPIPMWELKLISVLSKSMIKIMYTTRIKVYLYCTIIKTLQRRY